MGMSGGSLVMYPHDEFGVQYAFTKTMNSMCNANTSSQSWEQDNQHGLTCLPADNEIYITSNQGNKLPIKQWGLVTKFTTAVWQGQLWGG